MVSVYLFVCLFVCLFVKEPMVWPTHETSCVLWPVMRTRTKSSSSSASTKELSSRLGRQDVHCRDLGERMIWGRGWEGGKLGRCGAS